ncbi:hypothetical protein AAFM71_01100 [Chromobacterium violaceum]|uniref:hypothetical protein n=1 Tax=Chromobacterium violaceum TaxID=536 RepID=UPI00385EB3AF
MAQCIQVTDSGQVQILNVAPEQCQQLIVLQPADYASLQTAANIWRLSATEMSQCFGMSFILILTCFLVADGFGQLIHFMEREK